MSKVTPFPDGLLAGELARLTGDSTDTLRHYAAVYQFLRFQIKEHKTGDPLEVNNSL